MMRKLYWFLLLISCLAASSAQAQIFKREKGAFKNNPTIKPNSQSKDKEKDKKRNEFDEFEEESPKLQFNTQFEPVKPAQAMPMVSSKDTTKIDEGELQVVEIQQEMRIMDDSSAVPATDEEADVSEDWVKIATYFSIFDTRNIDPYGIDAKDFDGAVDIQLFDATKNQLWSAPLNVCKITSNFGPRWGRLHAGVDLDLETGDPVYAAFDGIVRIVSYNGNGYGRFVVIRHYNGLETLYGHLSRQLVEPNTYVKAGDVIGLGGNTGRSFGDHLHFETRYEGNPFNPIQVFNFPTNTLLADHLIITKETFNLSSRYESEFSTAKKVNYRNTTWTRVRSGQTLAEIARKFGTTPQKIAKLNRISTKSTIRSGQRMRVK